MHAIFTFVADVSPGRLDDLHAYLDEVEKQVPKHPDLPFEKLKKLHYASFVVVRDPDDRFKPCLVFENNIDGTPAAYIDDLCEIAPNALHAIYSHCEGYHAAAFDTGYVREFLRTRLVRPSAAFVGNVGRDVGRIERECVLVRSLSKWADALRATSPGAGPQELYEKLRASATAKQGWALQPKGRLSVWEIARRYADLALVFLPAVFLLPLMPAILTVFFAALRFHEMRDRPEQNAPGFAHVARVTLREDKLRQNHFANVTVVKPGLFRQLTLRLVLRLVGRFARISVHGTLSRLDNIHFAHWALLDGGRRLLFLTNYDGSWENYLDDFIDKAAVGLTAIWSNVEGFPKTSYLVRGGARDERNFKNIARRTQVRTAVWYSAYPALSVPSIDNDSALRDGLAKPPRGAEIDRWLQRL